jgi:hypothetical protein
LEEIGRGSRKHQLTFFKEGEMDIILEIGSLYKEAMPWILVFWACLFAAWVLINVALYEGCILYQDRWPRGRVYVVFIIVGQIASAFCYFCYFEPICL